MARRSKCTPEIRDRVVRAVKLGMTYAYAAQYGGIDISTFYRWMSAGRKAPHGRYREFHDAVKQADAAAAVESLVVIKKAAYEGRWTAAAWLLERRFGYVRGGVEPQTDTAPAEASELSDEEAWNQTVAELAALAREDVAAYRRLLNEIEERRKLRVIG